MSEGLTNRELRAWLEREMALGLDVVPRPSAARSVPVPPRQTPEAGVSRAAEPAVPAATRPVAPASALSQVLVEPEIRAASSLEALREVLGDCRRCKLCKGRTNIVFGVGSPSARLMFVGEGPGEDEDRKGEPFVGKAGELLTTIITNGMGLARSDVYIANVVKCRPPNNRDP